MIWDFPTRFTHWLLVLCVSTCLMTGYANGDWLVIHQIAGVSVLTLVLFRVIWGFVGNEQARFKNFVPTLKRFKSYRKNPDQIIGHNPLGAMSVFIMLFLLLLQTCTGLFATEEDSEFTAPLSALVSEEMSLMATGLHLDFVNGVIGIVALHISAIAYHQFIKSKPIIKTMIMGK